MSGAFVRNRRHRAGGSSADGAGGSGEIRADQNLGRAVPLVGPTIAGQLVADDLASSAFKRRRYDQEARVDGQGIAVVGLQTAEADASGS